jgi:glycosyltransferase involved in cell wall biosynthesis
MLGKGSLNNQLHVEAQKHGIPVEFPGWQDPLTYLSRADLVLSTSREESYGASIIEALAAGVPVVAPNVGIAREAGAVIADRDIVGLAKAVVGVLRTGEHGVLRLTLLTAQEWAQRWRESLV